MSFSKGINASGATGTKNRTPNSISPFSGMCTVCIEGCPGLCEVGRAAFRGKETIYPQPFGTTTSASGKDYPVDYSHFNVMGTAVGAHGIAADSDKATFPAVDVSSEVGAENKIKLKSPIVIAGMGSTNVAANNWEGLSIGAAITGTIIVVGENVCGMDPDVELKNGRVVHSPNMVDRIKHFQRYYNGYGAIAVQANVEDTRLGVQEYAIDKLGVKAVEIKWGQGAKDIGGEVKLDSLERALQLKSRGYIVLPDPEDEMVQEAFKDGQFKEFERHSRIGMVEEDGFHKRVEELRNAGAEHVFLKTGAYRPVDLARAVKFASDAKIDLLTVDGAGGGTGMSPWRMMNEWGIPSVELHSLLYQYCHKLKQKGEFVPDLSLAGGFTLEDQIYKGLSIAAPYVKLIGMARSPIAAAMVGKTIGRRINEDKLPVYVERFGRSVEEVFVTASDLKDELGEETFKKVPPGALGLYTYYERLAQGLRQMMCGSRKFALEHISRDDIAALTREAAEVSGISYVMDTDQEEVEKILNM